MKDDTNRYEIFLKTVEFQNITKAAEVLNYTQSGVSHAISALEKETGFLLFTRSSNGVSLTENGKKLLPYIQTLVNTQRNYRQAVYEINNVVKGTLKVGTFTSVSAQWLPGLIKEFLQLYPDVDFDLLSGKYSEIEEWVLQGKVDCGFLTAPVTENISFHILKREPMYVVLPENHPLAERESLTLEAIRKEPFIMLKDYVDDDIEQVIAQIPEPVSVRFRLHEDFAVISMVEEGFGITVMPELILKNFRFRVAVRPFSPPQYRTIGIGSRRQDNTSVVAKVFIRFLREKFSQ